MQSRVFAFSGVVEADEPAPVGGGLNVVKAQIAGNSQDSGKLWMERRLPAGELDVPARRRPVQERPEHPAHKVRIEKVMLSLARDGGKTHRTGVIAAVGDVDDR